MIHFLFIILFHISSVSFAGGSTVGNGGDVLICQNPDKSFKSAELLDFYEARVIRKIEARLGLPEESWQQKVSMLIERVRKINPTRALRFEKYFAEIQGKDMQMVRGVKFDDIPDSQHLFLPINCEIHQTAIQRTPLHPEDVRYFINADIWDLLDNNQKAGLIFHEIIYREFILAGFKDSVAVRYYNSYVAADLLADLSDVEYLALASRIPLPDIDIHGFNFAICRPKRNFSGEIDQCGYVRPPLYQAPSNGNPRKVFGFLLSQEAPWSAGIIQNYHWQGNDIAIAGNFSAEWSLDSSDFQSLVLNFEKVGNWVKELKFNDKTFYYNKWIDKTGKYEEFWDGRGDGQSEDIAGVDAPGRWSYHGIIFSHGVIYEARFHYGGPFLLKGSKSFVCFGEKIRFYPDGSLAECTVSREGGLYYKTETEDLFLKDTNVSFNENGDVISAEHLKRSKVLFQNQWIPITRFYSLENGVVRISPEEPIKLKWAGGSYIITSGVLDFRKASKEILYFDMPDDAPVMLNFAGNKLPVDIFNSYQGGFTVLLSRPTEIRFKKKIIEAPQRAELQLDLKNKNLICRYSLGETPGVMYPCEERKLQ